MTIRELCEWAIKNNAMDATLEIDYAINSPNYHPDIDDLRINIGCEEVIIILP